MYALCKESNKMATLISDIPDDIEDGEFVYTSDKKGGWLSFSTYKEYFILILAALVALKMPIDFLRNSSVAEKFLTFGDIPVRTLFIALLFAIFRKLSGSF